MIPRLIVRRSLSVSDHGVALTFDDGPDPTFTPLILDELARLNAKATFFAVGECAQAYPAIIRRMIAEGHSVGSHSQTHAKPGSLRWRVVADFRLGRRSVETAAQQRVALFRPPNGCFGSREQVAALLAGASTWLWTIDAEDWRPRATAASILARVDGMASGDVVLLHDGLRNPRTPEARDRWPTVAALPEIVGRLRAQALEPVPLPAAA